MTSHEDDQRKVEAYDAARAVVKREGFTRAEYVLRAEHAEAELAAAREALAAIRRHTMFSSSSLAREICRIVDAALVDTPERSER